MRVIVSIGLLAAMVSAANASIVRSAAQEGGSTVHTLQRIHVTTPPIPLEASARLATEIIYARVEGKRSEFPERGLATTVYTVRVLSAVKGTSAATMEVSVAGAVSESRRVEVEGAPSFAIGDELVLFLWRSPHGEETGILGLERGAYRVSIDNRGRRSVDGEHAPHVGLSEFLDTVGNAWLRAETQANRTQTR
jgi:hypothetical protein